TFSLRYPLVDGQGNFGNVDGDNAAAMRYTEARLTAAAGELMAGLDEGTVDFRPTYNGEEEEPEVFPGLFPNLLANGASGMAGGQWQLVISEIPFQVPKSKLIEQIAALVTDKKLPILADVRDESDAEIRIVIEPRSRNIDPDLLAESLFRLTDLEVKIPLNLNVLDE